MVFHCTLFLAANFVLRARRKRSSLSNCQETHGRLSWSGCSTPNMYVKMVKCHIPTNNFIVVILLILPVSLLWFSSEPVIPFAIGLYGPWLTLAVRMRTVLFWPVGGRGRPPECFPSCPLHCLPGTGFSRCYKQKIPSPVNVFPHAFVYVSNVRVAVTLNLYTFVGSAHIVL